MSFDARLLNLSETAKYIGKTRRWLYRNWPMMVQGGVRAYRLPKDSERGTLMFEKEALDKYINACQIQPAIIRAQV